MILNRSSILSILILASLTSLFALALNPTSQGNYFYVPSDNHLSYELYQTKNGTIAHSIEPLDDTRYISRYSLINLDTKDAFPIFSDLVSSCNNLNPTFQSLHYHAPSDSLVYYCARNASLLILNQQDHIVQTSIALGAGASLPIAKLSTDGVNVVILLMDTLFTQNPENSVLLKVDMQSKQVVSQIYFNEAVVAYAAGKNRTYVATNLNQGGCFITLYSLALTGNTYQLTQIANFSSSTTSSKIITKLVTLGDFIVVNNGGELKFFNQQGTVVKSAQIQTKSLTNQTNGLSHPAFAAQYDGANLYAIRNYNSFCVYSVANNAIQRRDVSDIYGDFQVAFGNSGGDLIFTSDNENQLFFFILEGKNFQPIYQTVSGYIDIILTDTTYTVIRGLYLNYIDEYISGYAFGLKNNTLVNQIDLSSSDKYYYNKDEQIISHMVPDVPSGCSLYRVDAISLTEWKSISFSTKDPICKAVNPVYARITHYGNIELVFRGADSYELLTETFGRLSFPATSNIDSLNVNLDKDLALYYLSANQATEQVTASLYAFNPLTKNFSRISTNTLENRPVENKGFFTVNQSTSVALSETSFAVINKIDSIYSEENFPNSYNMLTSFTDNAQYTLFGYSNSKLAVKGDAPRLFSSSEGFIEIPNKRANTVNARATGRDTFALHDVLPSKIGVVRFFSTKTEKKTIEKETISI